MTLNSNPTDYEPLEAYFSSATLAGLIRSGLTLLRARQIHSADNSRQGSRLTSWRDHFLYFILIVIPAIVLETYHRMRTWITGEPKRHPQGSWQWALYFSLRGDLAHHTCETIGYHRDRPPEATEVDDLAAWVMALIQFLWSYDDLMGVIWQEWTLLKLVKEAARLDGLENEPQFVRLQRQWELARPYNAPLNGTYADVRRAAFNAFISPRIDTLPPHLKEHIFSRYSRLKMNLPAYQKQMSVMARLAPGLHRDSKEPVPLWETNIGLIHNGEYYLINVADRDESGAPVVYGQGGVRWPLGFVDGAPVAPDGTALIVQDGQVHRADDGEWLGYLDLAPASRVKGQVQAILAQPLAAETMPGRDLPDPDLLLAETPRDRQHRLRSLLPEETQHSLALLSRTPIIINWDMQRRDRSLAEIRRANRGIGDHALVIMRTADSIIFDQSHVFFDGNWSLAMAEVLTTAAVHWAKRCITIAPGEAPPPRSIPLVSSTRFTREALNLRQYPEISAETTIYDIATIFELRQLLLEKTITRLTVNDLLVITRIFHAAHYRPSPQVQEAIDVFRQGAESPLDRRAVDAIERSLERGRLINPALAIPVDASPFEPGERIFLLTFRNLTEHIVTIWDDTWDAYQAYRRIEPPDTPEGQDALQHFLRKRTFLIGNLRAFSHILAASKAVALRGDSLSVAIFNMLSHLPAWLQRTLNTIPDRVPLLNEIVKGDEVYSNVGRVARGSSLTRFMSAKDDGNTKDLVWGVMTDDENRLYVTMRDFRPHVEPLIQAGRIDLARLMAQDYVQSYTRDLIGLVARLTAMLQVEIPGRGETR
jgi:hypothetical protein